jgi:2'-5' RNA ligase
MRLFTAVDIPDDVKAALDSFQKRLRPTAKLSWSHVDKLHITTKFIGEWPEAQLPELTRALAGVPACGGIDIAVRGFGWFPDARRPRVFWVGVEGGERLHALAQATEQAVAKLGVPVEERAYAPHLTLARIREKVPLGALHHMLQSFPSGLDFGAFRATRFFLYLSAGGHYTQLAGFPLE